MKCPQCGQWNRASIPVCQHCGAPLVPTSQQKLSWKEVIRDDQHGTEYYRMDEHGESDATPDARDALAMEMAELKIRKAAGVKRQRRLREQSAQRGSAPSGMNIHTSGNADRFWTDEQSSATRVQREIWPRLDDETAAVDEPTEQVPTQAEADRAPDSRQEGARVRMVGVSDGQRASSRTVIRHVGVSDEEMEATWDNTHNWDPLWAEQEAYGTRWQSRATSSVATLPARNKARRRILQALGIIMGVALVGLCGFFGYHYFDDRRQAELEANRASVVASLVDELAAHTIMIPGDDGAQIYIRELHTAYIVTGGYATITVADHLWYDNLDDLLDPTMEITLTPFLKTSSGRQQPLERIVYTIDIPPSPVKMITPDAARVEVASSMYTMKFEVRPGSKVYINDRDVSDTVNSTTGEFSYNATIQPIGDNVFVLRCRSQYCRETRMSLTVYREPQEIPLDLAADTYTSTSLSAMLVNCTTLPGATVQVLSNHSDLNITNLDSTGAFSFYALFSEIGDNVIEIHSSYPGKKTSVVKYTVYYLPTEDVYSRKAWKLDEAGYSELVSNISVRAARHQIYVVYGTLQYFISEKPQLAVFNTSDDGKGQPVLVENFTKISWEQGTWYRIYADVQGSYNNMPRLNGRFTHLN